MLGLKKNRSFSVFFLFFVCFCFFLIKKINTIDLFPESQPFQNRATHNFQSAGNQQPRNNCFYCYSKAIWRCPGLLRNIIVPSRKGQIYSLSAQASVMKCCFWRKKYAHFKDRLYLMINFKKNDLIFRKS